MSTDENTQLEAAVNYLRKPYMNDPRYGKELEDLLRKTIIKKKFLERHFSGELTRDDKIELGRIFGKYDKKHKKIMKIIKTAHKREAVEKEIEDMLNREGRTAWTSLSEEAQFELELLSSARGHYYEYVKSKLVF